MPGAFDALSSDSAASSFEIEIKVAKTIQASGLRCHQTKHGPALTHGRTDDRLASLCESVLAFRTTWGSRQSSDPVATTLAKPIDNRTQFAGELM